MAPLSVFPGWDFFINRCRTDHVPYILKDTVLQGKILFPLLRLDPLQSIRSDLIWEKETECLMTLDSSYCMVQIGPLFYPFPRRRILRQVRPLPFGDQAPGRSHRGHYPRARAGAEALPEIEDADLPDDPGRLLSVLPARPPRSFWRLFRLFPGRIRDPPAGPALPRRDLRDGVRQGNFHVQDSLHHKRPGR